MVTEYLISNDDWFLVHWSISFIGIHQQIRAEICYTTLKTISMLHACIRVCVYIKLIIIFSVELFLSIFFLFNKFAFSYI